MAGTGAVSGAVTGVPKKPPTLENWDDIANHVGMMDVLLTKMAAQQDRILDRVEAVEKVAEATRQSVGRIDADKMQQAIIDEVEKLRKGMAEVRSRQDRDHSFAANDVFMQTLTNRIGEEVRSSLRTESVELGRQVFNAVNDFLKQNPVKPATGSAWVPILSLIGAIAGVTQIYWWYSAQQKYVPADVNVKVNGVSVPHVTEAAVHSMNGHALRRQAA